MMKFHNKCLFLLLIPFLCSCTTKATLPELTLIIDNQNNVVSNVDTKSIADEYSSSFKKENSFFSTIGKYSKTEALCFASSNASSYSLLLYDVYDDDFEVIYDQIFDYEIINDDIKLINCQPKDDSNFSFYIESADYYKGIILINKQTKNVQFFEDDYYSYCYFDQLKINDTTILKNGDEHLNLVPGQSYDAVDFKFKNKKVEPSKIIYNDGAFYICQSSTLFPISEQYSSSIYKINTDDLSLDYVGKIQNSANAIFAKSYL